MRLPKLFKGYIFRDWYMKKEETTDPETPPKGDGEDVTDPSKDPTQEPTNPDGEEVTE